MENIEVLVLLDVSGLEDEEKLNKFLKRKSFKVVEGDNNTYNKNIYITNF